MRYFSRIGFFLLLLTAPTFAQGVPTAGTRFTFAVPEGSDHLSPDQTGLNLILVSPYDGEGVVYSPSGVEITFSFTADVAVEIILPYSLMLLNDLGKTNKGVLVYTTQPVNLTLHLLSVAAGEATQIYPDVSLGTDYLVSEWGLFDDVDYFTGATIEHNKTQIAITAAEDNTDVTITPTVLCLGGHPAKQPITVTLNRGECYILKADSTGIPKNISLCRSTVRSSKPVSVISALTCAYVPLGLQACNALLDHILPLNSADTVFYASPPSAPDHKSRLLFISPRDTFYVLTTTGFIFQTQTGRISLPMSQADKFVTSAPALCHQFTAGYESTETGDPSMTPVLPQRYWIDTMLWFAPLTKSRFDHFVSVVFPTAEGNNVLLDGRPIALSPQVTPIANSTMSAATMQILDGIHHLNSTVPVFAISSGFMTADAYMAVAMGRAPPINYADIPTSLATNISSANTCQDIFASVAMVGDLRMSDDIHRYQLTVTYDPSQIRLVSAAPGAFLPAGSIINTATPGTVSVVVSQKQTIVGSGELMQLVFRSVQGHVNVPIKSELQLSQLDYALLQIAKITTTNSFDIVPHRDSATASLSVIARSETLGDTTFATIFLEQPLPGVYSEVRIRLKYNHDLMQFVNVAENSTLLVGWDALRLEIDDETDEFTFRPRGVTAKAIIGKGSLTRLRCATFVTDTDATEIQLSGYFTNADSCPTDVMTRDTTGKFVGITSCGDSSLIAFIHTLPIRITGIIPNPVKDQFQVTIAHALAQSEDITFSLITAGGDNIWEEYKLANAGPTQSIILTLPSYIPSGSYQLTASARGRYVSRNVVIVK